VRRGRRREHHGGGGHQPNKVAAVGVHPSGGSTVRVGREGGFSDGTPVTGSSSGGSNGLEHREVNRRGEARSGRDGRRGGGGVELTEGGK
jgi:hypothetical protein